MRDHVKAVTAGGFLASGLAAVLVGCLCLTLGLAGCGKGESADAVSAESAEVPRNVRVLNISPTDLEEYLTISGPAYPLRGTDVSAEESGRVDAIPHDKGSLVRAGNALIVLDRRLLEAQMNSANASRDLQAYNEDRTRRLLESNSVSRIEMLQAETQLKAAEAAARQAAIRYERAVIKAPFDGMVTDRFVEPGQLVTPGMPVARIIDPYVLKLKGTVTERDIAHVVKGKPASVAFDGVAGVAEGRVHWVGFEADPLTGKFQVEVRIENKDLKLHPGVIGRARILKARHEDAITIPRDAIVLRAGGPVVYVADGSVARQRPVRLGADQGLMVVVESGLELGDLLIVRGQRDIHDGSAILVQEKAVAADGSLPADPSVVTQAHTVSEAWQDSPSRGGVQR
ncbi:MAG: efflux RND transporter periplasmic adaptor subunit [Candidatus Eisenbacteria sp.]|nr:efflux RND transporter periplasmic adaptor subunit [Candidatus Eisenbacteria bacterium]